MIRIVNEVDFSGFDELDLGGDWDKTIRKERIKGATLLSIEEYEKYKNNIPKLSWGWWLRSPGSDSYNAWFVCSDGRTTNNYFVITKGGIRPVLILDFQSSNNEIGDEFEFGKHYFTVISSNLAICNNFLTYSPFRDDWKKEDANDYNKSDIKEIVDDWFDKAYTE